MPLRIKTKKAQLERFAKQKFQQYVLDNWRIVFVNEDYQRGSYAHCILAFKEICIEEKTVKEFKIHTLKDIFLHELAHALLGGINKVKGFPQHGKLFREMCKNIGCKGYRATNKNYVFDMYGKFNASKEQEYKAFLSSPDYKKIIINHKTK
jgi:predicted SprT family Zn-dependent metalloprotease